jgi:hypothetical protein
MNGATAEPSESTMSKESSTMKTTIGVNHHFFRVLRKPQISLALDIFSTPF